MIKMVEVRGYVRNGDTLFWQLPSGKYMRVGTSRLLKPYIRMLKKDKQKLYKINFKHKVVDKKDSVIIPAVSSKQAQSYFLKLNGTYWKIIDVKVVR